MPASPWDVIISCSTLGIYVIFDIVLHHVGDIFEYAVAEGRDDNTLATSRGVGISAFPAGVLAFSRILNDGEVVVVAATNPTNGFRGEVIVDHELNPAGIQYRVLYSNKRTAGGARAPGAVVDKPAGSVTIHEIDGTATTGRARTLPVDLQAAEIQILGP